jgi:hypothetical protein
VSRVHPARPYAIAVNTHAMPHRAGVKSLLSGAMKSTGSFE